MPRAVRTGVAGVAALLLVHASADAYGWGVPVHTTAHYYPAYRIAYYYPGHCWSIPVYCPPVVPVYPAAPVVVLPTPYAKPRPAPPSGTSEPPTEKPDQRAPKVVESRYEGGSTATATTVKDKLRVGFWNLTGRDVTLTIDGQRHTVARNRAITLTLGRSFSWKMGEDPLRTEDVPSDQASFEVLLRPPG
jgi:hypothetical protein